MKQNYICFFLGLLGLLNPPVKRRLSWRVKEDDVEEANRMKRSQ